MHTIGLWMIVVSMYCRFTVVPLPLMEKRSWWKKRRLRTIAKTHWDGVKYHISICLVDTLYWYMKRYTPPHATRLMQKCSSLTGGESADVVCSTTKTNIPIHTIHRMYKIIIPFIFWCCLHSFAGWAFSWRLNRVLREIHNFSSRLPCSSQWNCMYAHAFHILNMRSFSCNQFFNCKNSTWMHLFDMSFMLPCFAGFLGKLLLIFDLEFRIKKEMIARLSSMLPWIMHRILILFRAGFIRTWLFGILQLTILIMKHFNCIRAFIICKNKSKFFFL